MKRVETMSFINSLKVIHRIVEPDILAIASSTANPLAGTELLQSLHIPHYILA